jgi:putative membrane protein
MLLEKRIPVRYIAEKIKIDLLNVLLISVVIEVMLYFNRAFLPDIPGTVPAFLGTAISLILSFKLNQSYERWWEARKIWGSVVNDSRTFVRQLLSFAGSDSETVRRACRRQVAWCYCLGQSLRELDWKTGTTGHISERDVMRVEKHSNKPVALLQLHAEDVAELAETGRLTDYQRIAVDETLSRLTNWMGMSERIKNTVFPRSYRLCMHAFIYLFIVALSIALHAVEGMWQIAITTTIAGPFLLLEKTAQHMQDPFENRPTDTAVTAIARTIEIDLRQLLGDDEIPESLAPERYYLM